MNLVVADSSFIYALLDKADQGHAKALKWYSCQPSVQLITTPPVLTEVDLLAGRIGVHTRTAFIKDVRNKAYDVQWSGEILRSSLDLAEKYADSGLSLTDASLLVLAKKFAPQAIATFDLKHFRLSHSEYPTSTVLVPD